MCPALRALMTSDMGEIVCLDTLNAVLHMESWDLLMAERCLAAVLRQFRDMPLLPDCGNEPLQDTMVDDASDANEAEPEPDMLPDELLSCHTGA